MPHLADLCCSETNPRLLPWITPARRKNQIPVSPNLAHLVEAPFRQTGERQPAESLGVCTVGDKVRTTGAVIALTADVVPRCPVCQGCAKHLTLFFSVASPYSSLRRRLIEWYTSFDREEPVQSHRVATCDYGPP